MHEIGTLSTDCVRKSELNKQSKHKTEKQENKKMENWFECKVTVDKEQMIGQEDNYSGSYLASALTCGEAERRVMEEVGLYCNGALTVNGIKAIKLYELFMNDDDEMADKWYKAKISLVEYDEKKEKEKKTTILIIVQASNFENALDRVKIGMRGTMSDYEITMIQETAIIDVFPFSADHIPGEADDNAPAKKHQSLTVDFTQQDNDTDTDVPEQSEE